MKRVICAVAAVLAAVCPQRAAGNPFSLSSDEFPIVMMGLSSRAWIPAIADDLKCDYVHIYTMCDSTNQVDLDYDRQFFDDAADNGAKVMACLRAWHWVDRTDGLQRMLACVEEFKDHPALGYWYLFDEPDNKNPRILPSTVEQYYQAVTSASPGVLVANAHASTTGRYDYANGQDLFMVGFAAVSDQPFPDAPVGSMVYLVEDGIEKGETVIPILQCWQRPLPGARFPNAAELRYTTYASIVVGARGLSWWEHSLAIEDMTWLNGTLTPVLRNLRDFVDTVEPAHGVDKVHGGGSETYYLGVWDRGSSGKWVALVNDRKDERGAFTAPMNRFSYDVTLWPCDGTRDSAARIVADVLEVDDLAPWETYVWEALPLGLDIPGNVQATPQSAGRIDVTWTDTSSTEDRFKIDRQSAGATNWVRIGNAPANATTYRDNTGLAPNSTYSYRVKANNANGNCRYSDEASATTLTGIDVRPATGSDDAEQNPTNGYMNSYSLDLDLVTSGPVEQLVGIRFPGISIPQGTRIDAATLEFTVAATSSVPTSLTLHGQAIDNAPAFTTNAYDISTRDTTAVSVDWNDVPAWLTVGGSGPTCRTPDLAPIVQAIVDRPGWTSGNALALIINGTGKRDAVSFDNNPTNAPYLHIHYSIPERFVAYNDLAWFDGQLSNGITFYTTTNNFPAGTPDGFLCDHATGQPLVVRVTVQGGGSPIEGQGLHPGPGTDARNVFSGRVNGDGAISYSGPDLVLTLTGLSSDKRYEFVLYGDRDGTGYTGGASRYQHAVLSGADSFVNASSPGTALLTSSVPNDTTLYNAGYNNTNGYVTRFSHIDPGADGTFVVTVVRDVGLSYYTYANAFMLASHDIVKVARGTSWKYRKGTDEASDPTHDWRTLSFNDTAWSNGVAPFGYGDGPYSTTLDDMQDNYLSVFLRTPFTIDRPTRVSRVELRALFDDGLIAWINGVEVGRMNMATGAGTFVPFDATAGSSINGPDEWVLVLEGRTLPSLVDGANILAVQVFNGTLSSSDLTLDCRLTVAESERVLEDADGDGMSDPWEIDSFGGTSVSNAANGQDFDLDGLSNIGEFIAGSNPDDPTDLFQVDVRVSDGNVIVSLDGSEATGAGYQAVTRFYAIEQRSALDPIGVWEAATGCEAVEATGQATIAYTNSSAEPMTLYRGRVWLETE